MLAAARTCLRQRRARRWRPFARRTGIRLYGFLRGRGHSAEDAQDLTQAFFARVLEKHTIGHADPARGRFRSFLLVSLKNFAANEHDKEIARKRGGGVPIVSLELEGAEGRFQLEPANDETPEKVFDRRWAVTLLDRVLSRLKTEGARSGQAVAVRRPQDIPDRRPAATELRPDRQRPGYVRGSRQGGGAPAETTIPGSGARRNRADRVGT